MIKEIKNPCVEAVRTALLYFIDQDQVGNKRRKTFCEMTREKLSRKVSASRELEFYCLSLLPDKEWEYYQNLALMMLFSR